MSDLLERRTAKAIRPSERFVNTILYLIEELFENRMYHSAEPNQRLADVVRRDLTYSISREQWGREGVQFERSGGLPLEGIYITFETDPNKQVPEGRPRPVLYSGGFQSNEDEPGWPRLLFIINGNLTKQEAFEQFDPHSPEFPNLQTVVKHEIVHLYDRQQGIDVQRYESQEELDKDENYFNNPAEVRAWTGNLIDEFQQFLRGHEGPVENRLVDSFLRGSRVWSLLNQHLTETHRRYVLHELSRELEAMKGSANAKPGTKVDLRGTVRR